MNVLSRLLRIAYVNKLGGSGPATFAGRIKPADWSARTGK